MGVYPKDTRWGVSKVNNPIWCFVYTKHKKEDIDVLDVFLLSNRIMKIVENRCCQ